MDGNKWGLTAPSLYISLPMTCCPSPLIFSLPFYPYSQPFDPAPPRLSPNIFFSEFSFTATPPTSLPLFFSLSSVCSRCRRSFAPVPTRLSPDLLDGRGVQVRPIPLTHFLPPLRLLQKYHLFISPKNSFYVTSCSEP